MADKINEKPSGAKDTAKTQAAAKQPEREHLAEPLSERARGVFKVIQNAIPDDASHVLEERVGQLPSVGLLGLAIGALGISATLALFNERKGWSNFFGNWVPSLLFLTVYSKLIKLEQAVSQAKAPTMH